MRATVSAARRALSINQATVPRWSALEVLEGCAAAGYRGVGLWRDRVCEEGVVNVAKRAARLGIEVTSLCRGGWFLVPEPTTPSARKLDNRQAVDEAAELGAHTLVIVSGPGPDRDLEGARRAVGEAVQDLARYASVSGVTLAIEPMHPLYCGDRSVVVTLAQALQIARLARPTGVGVVLDSYHIWWDPELEGRISDAAGSIFAVQLADWLAPPPDPLNGRGMLGDGTIDLRRFCQLCRGAGYEGLFEVEIFNPEIWALDPAETLELIAQRYAAHLT
jgi:sugar phosphate isomerase/epimerase